MYLSSVPLVCARQKVDFAGRHSATFGTVTERVGLKVDTWLLAFIGLAAFFSWKPAVGELKPVFLSFFFFLLSLIKAILHRHASKIYWLDGCTTLRAGHCQEKSSQNFNGKKKFHFREVCSGLD